MRVWHAFPRNPLRALNLVLFVLIGALLLRETASTERLLHSPRLIPLAIAACAVGVFFYLAAIVTARAQARLMPCFALLCVVAELGLRTANSFGVLKPANTADWLRPAPYMMFTGPLRAAITSPEPLATGIDALIRFNDQGFRLSHNPVLPKPKEELRIFMLGGSTLVLGSPNTASISFAVEQHLQQTGLRNARVYNFGVVAFISGQELALLVHRLLELSPDMIVVYDGANDIMGPWGQDPRPDYPFNFAVWEQALSRLESTNRQNERTLAVATSDSALLSILFRGAAEREMATTLDRQRLASEYGGAEWQSAIARQYLHNVETMCRAAQSAGARFASFLQPLLAFADPLDSQQIRLAGGESTINYARGMRVRFRSLLRQLPSDCHANDLSAIFANRPGAFWDFVHIHSSHNDLIGQQIAEVLWKIAPSTSDSANR